MVAIGVDHKEDRGKVGRDRWKGGGQVCLISRVSPSFQNAKLTKSCLVLLERFSPRAFKRSCLKKDP